MLVYKCDGELYSTGKKCENEVENDLPEWWLTITGNIKNGLYKRIISRQMVHITFAQGDALKAFYLKT